MSWSEYLENTRKKYVPRPLLVEALTYVKSGRSALDLGAGALNDTRHLIANDFYVTVVDSNPEVLSIAAALPPDMVEVHIATFDSFEFPSGAYDLVNAQYSLPFNPPETFNTMFDRLSKSLKKTGVLTGQFFGDKDEWFGHEGMRFFTKSQVLALLRNFDVKVFREEEADRPTAAGEQKHWHVFHVIALKN